MMTVFEAWHGITGVNVLVVRMVETVAYSSWGASVAVVHSQRINLAVATDLACVRKVAGCEVRYLGD